MAKDKNKIEWSDWWRMQTRPKKALKVFRQDVALKNAVGGKRWGCGKCVPIGNGFGKGSLSLKCCMVELTNSDGNVVGIDCRQHV